MAELGAASALLSPHLAARFNAWFNLHIKMICLDYARSRTLYVFFSTRDFTMQSIVTACDAVSSSFVWWKQYDIVFLVDHHNDIVAAAFETLQGKLNKSH